MAGLGDQAVEVEVAVAPIEFGADDDDRLEIRQAGSNGIEGGEAVAMQHRHLHSGGLEPEGQRFDPNFHQAMFEIPNPEVPNGTVLQVVQAGYAIGDRVLRPAMVGVSKGGPKAAPAEAKGAEAEARAGQ